ncbi:MAG: DUF2442 domain-containing protein [Cyanobacteria bacterium]|nr:DUF2442 domain-containing protein [Cyanobacteriota bacterium]
MIPRPTHVRALPNFRIWLEYDDGSRGEVDLSDLAARGVFEAWTRPGVFESVHLGARGAIEWGAELDLCPDAMYLRLTQKKPEDLFPSLKSVHA